MAKKNDVRQQYRGVEIRIRGLVQGVGFRPTVWQLARQCELVGEVLNDGEGVLIHCWGTDANIKKFLTNLPLNKPPLSRIDAIECIDYPQQNTFHDFSITASIAGPVSTSIIPDAATCDHCIKDIFDKEDRRYRYPFTNCTHCGPRLSITRAIPYDRANTSMAAFKMCANCLAEYQNPADRRFHAQPNACPDCGPQLWLCERDGKQLQLPKNEDAISYAAKLITNGHILAIKGIGGFHLTCDATNTQAVTNLRQRKKRYGKPLALMAKTIDMIRHYAIVSESAEQHLEAVSAPIIILPKINENSGLSKDLAPSQTSLGFMLPYTPMHHLLLSELDMPLVMTSGNLSSEPQVTDNAEALKKLAPIADHWLLNDRDIINRLDDSIVQEVSVRASMLRRARGYAPEPFILPEGFENMPNILAMGAQLKNTFCLLKNGKAIVSQHIGDLEDMAAHEDYRKALRLYQQAHDFKPETIVVDMHPEYFSSKWGKRIASENDVPIVEVQHHHAHIAACMVEHQLPLDTTPVLGIALDGLGYGERAELWGGEFLIADYKSYQRIAHFEPVAIPGGALASYEPWRNSFAHLSLFMGWQNVEQQYANLEIVKYLKTKPLQQMTSMIERNLNAPKASSAGRLFDAVAGALGVCRERVDFEGQAAMELQALAEKVPDEKHSYGVDMRDIISWSRMWQGIMNDLANNIPTAQISARFHNTLIKIISTTALNIVEKYKLETVILTGGVFQNILLSEGISEEISRNGLRVLMPEKFPSNDGGISLGQVIICAARSSDN